MKATLFMVPGRKRPHLISTLAAILILLSSLIAGEAHARAVEARFIYALAPVYTDELRRDSVLEQVALDQPDMLMLLGSSEIKTGDPFNARELFQTRPTGFAVYEVGGDGNEVIIFLQEIAGLRSSLKGEKIVISLTPGPFLEYEMSDHWYAANFSILDANELVFRTEMDFGLKQAAARRMLEYPDTLRQDPLLAFALRNLASDNLANRALFFATLPLGQVHTWILQLQNHWKTLDDIAKQSGLNPDIPRQEKSLDWKSLQVQASQLAAQKVGDNPFGITDELWHLLGKGWLEQRNDLSDRVFLDQLKRSRGWKDLDLLLSVLRDQGARPLIITLPLNGLFYDYRGVTATARAQYYEKLRQMGARYGVPVVTFEDHEDDQLFFQDISHPSVKGWSYYDQVLDAYYHETLP